MSAHIEGMKQTLVSITDLADIAGSPDWSVTDVPVNMSAPRHEIRSGGMTLDFGTDTASAYLTAASVNVAPELASGVLDLLRMAEKLPAEADEHARSMAAAVLNLVQNLPEVENGGQVTP